VGRKPRIEVAGGSFHVTVRANNREWRLTEASERRLLLWTFGRAVKRCGWHCCAYCVMSNHAHFMIETPEPNLAVGMHWFGTSFARTHNRRHGRVGHFFESRYDAGLIETDAHLVAASRYIVLNPVRAGVVERPGDYLWSSYRATAGLVRNPPLLDDTLLLGFFSDDLFVARARWVAFVADGLEDPLLGRTVS
jgi:REP element-mobilizing transposase RayT